MNMRVSSLCLTFATILVVIFQSCVSLRVSNRRSILAPHRGHFPVQYGQHSSTLASSIEPLDYTLGRTSEEKFRYEDLSFLDLGDILGLAMAEFESKCTSTEALWGLRKEIVFLFLPKLLVPSIMGHSVICVKDGGELVGFVDLSLQSNKGSLDVLKPRTLAERSAACEPGELQPYLSNLLVSPKYRKRGIGSLLVSLCELRAKDWGYQQLNLHVEMKAVPALCLYLGAKFDTVQETKGLLFMRKNWSDVPNEK
jgi:ribosomal protein S18 acetylase RimI-like enzyme